MSFFCFFFFLFSHFLPILLLETPSLKLTLTFFTHGRARPAPRELDHHLRLNKHRGPEPPSRAPKSPRLYVDRAHRRIRKRPSEGEGLGGWRLERRSAGKGTTRWMCERYHTLDNAMSCQCCGRAALTGRYAISFVPALRVEIDPTLAMFSILPRRARKGLQYYKYSLSTSYPRSPPS